MAYSYNKKFPSLYVSEKEKDDNWCESVIDGVVNYLANDSGRIQENRTSDIINYEIYNGYLNNADLDYMTNQYGSAFPARLVNYPIIQPKIDLLLVEEIRRPIDYKVTTVNKNAVIRKQDAKVNLIARQLLEKIHDDFKSRHNFILPGDEQALPIPDDVDLFMRYNYREAVEEVAQDGLEYLMQIYNLKDIFKAGFRDMLITGKEFYKIEVKNGDPFVRRVDPRNFVCDINAQSDYLHDSVWAGEERWLSVNEILDEFRDEMSQDQINDLIAIQQIGSYDALKTYNEPVEWVSWENDKSIRVRVVTVEWKSIRALKFKISENKYDPDRPFRKFVPDDYRPRKNEKIEKRNIDDIWEGTKIGGKILVRCRRRPNQVRSVDDPGSTPLSYVGCIRNNTTGRSISMVDLLKNIQIMYNIVMYHIELALARSGGKAVVYDVAQLPTNLGMDMQSVMYHLKSDGIIPINSKEEGNQTQTFNQFQQIDFTLSNSVQQLINLKLMLEETAGQVSGVSRQREGAVGQYEYVGNVQRSVVQSATVTETWFYSHNMIKKQVLERLCNTMKISWSQGKKAGYILGDGAYKFLNALPDIAFQDYGVYVGDSGKDDAMRQAVMQLSQAALQNGSVGLLDVIKVLKADSMSEAEAVLERGLDEMRKQQEMQQEQQVQMMQAEQEAKMAEKQTEAELKQLDNEAQINIAEMNNQTKLQIAEMQSDDKRAIADMKEKVNVNRDILKSELDKNKQKDSVVRTALGREGATSPRVAQDNVDRVK